MPSDKSVSDLPIQQFMNCYLLRDHQIVKDNLYVRDGKILNPERLFYDEQGYADVQINCHGAIICAGYIDTQINGAFGIDFSYEIDNVAEGVQRVAKGLLAHGVTSFCPTVITSPQDMYRKILPHIKKKNGDSSGAGILGLHLEGPFISQEKKGAHPPQFVTNFDNGFKDIMNMYGYLDDVSIVTLAPEHTGSCGVIKQLVNKGITVSVGHSVANLSQGEEAVHCGASFITHLFNAMLPFHHRDPHLVGLLTSDKIPEDRTVFYGLIADGIHTHPAALRIAHRVHPKGLVLVTDAVPAMGLGDGKHHIGKQDVEITGKRAVIAGTDTLCGSIAPMSECVRNFCEMSECSKVEALEAATLHPAQVLGICHQKGTLDYKTDADFLILDNDLNVMATYIAGEKVWEAEGGSNCTQRKTVP